jgi:Kef-type K+ transport system membrane component KefB
VFSEFGISFLLFIVGLHLNPKSIKEVGKSAFLIGFLQILSTFSITFLISKFLLGYSNIVSIYVGVALAFSSTIIIMKLLSDKKQLDSLFGKLSIGILIIQDLVAIAALMLISSTSKNAISFSIQNVLVGGLIILSLFFIGYFVLPKMMNKIAKSQELLFLFSICWCFVLAALFTYIGFSMEIGSLVAGVILSVSPYATEISSKIRPLRDFFLIIFFIILGLKVQINNLKEIIFNAIILSGIALIIKPFVIMFIMKFSKYAKRINFLVGSTLAQISEFSLILIGLGVAAGQVPTEILNTIILTMVITILFSSYMIIYSSKLYLWLTPVLKIFGEDIGNKQKHMKREFDTILFGYNRIGFSILNCLKGMKRKYLVVDFNPDTINSLRKFEIPSIYGDVYDSDFLEELPLSSLSLAVSTIPDVETNKLLIEKIKKANTKTTVILRAHTIEDALELYNCGANYVLTPHFLGGEYVAKMIEHSKSFDDDYSMEKEKHIEMLKGMLEKGVQHPRVERN